MHSESLISSICQWKNSLGGLLSIRSLIDILIQHFFRNTPTYFALGYFYVYLDYFYPKGGTGALVDLFTKKLLDCGGEIKLNKHIVAVNPSDSTVTDSEGDSYAYDHLIWAADLKTLYRISKSCRVGRKINCSH